MTLKDGTVRESRKTKIVPVEHWRGAIAYWGLAEETNVYKWSTLKWIQERAGQANRFNSPEDFAHDIADKLNKAISAMKFEKDIYSGIGIHFTAYEFIDGYWIPELFRLSNFTDSTCTALYPDGIHVSRETYNVINDVTSQPNHREPQYRIAVHKYLDDDGRILIYNNGDPLMFNPISEGILNSIREIARRGNLIERSNIATYRAIAQLPVDVVSSAQRKFAQKGTRLVGGKPHNLAVTPQGIYSSDTGDI